MGKVETPQVKVGDELAFLHNWDGYVIHKVVKVSPTGRLTMDNGVVLNPDLRVRGDSHRKRANGWRGEIVTPKILEEVAASKAKQYLLRLDDWVKKKDRTNQQIIELAQMVKQFIAIQEPNDAKVQGG